MFGGWCWLLAGSSSGAVACTPRCGFSTEMRGFFLTWGLGSKGKSPQRSESQEEALLFLWPPFWSHNTVKSITHLWRISHKMLPSFKIRGNRPYFLMQAGKVLDEHVVPTVMLVPFLDSTIYHSNYLWERKTTDLFSMFHKEKKKHWHYTSILSHKE